jgi:hypothetical protein
MSRIPKLLQFVEDQYPPYTDEEFTDLKNVQELIAYANGLRMESSWGDKRKNLIIGQLDLKRLRDTIMYRRSAFNIVEWMFLEELLTLKNK